MITNMPKISSLLAVTFIAASVRAEAVIDLIQIAGKTQSQVSRYLGLPISCSGSGNGLKCRYDRGQTEIIYFEGKADWITVHGIDHLEFNSDAVTYLGLAARKPDSEDGDSMEWNNIDGLFYLSLIKGTRNADYARIKVTGE